MTLRGEYRSLYTVLPDAPEFQRLSKDARLLLYTLKMSLGPLGIANLYDEPLRARAGMSQEELDAARSELIQGDWIIVSGRVHWLRNGLRFEPTLSLDNKKHIAFIEKELRGLLCCAIANRFAEHYGLDIPFPECGKDTLSPPPGYPIPSSDTSRETIPHPTPETPHQRSADKSADASADVENPNGNNNSRSGDADAELRARLAPSVRRYLWLSDRPPSPSWSMGQEISIARQMVARGYSVDEVAEQAPCGLRALIDRGQLPHVERGKPCTYRVAQKGQTRGAMPIVEVALHAYRKYSGLSPPEQSKRTDLDRVRVGFR